MVKDNQNGTESERTGSAQAGEFRLEPRAELTAELDSLVHLMGHGIRCDTERRGHRRPQGRSPFELVVNASEGFIPLWDRDTTLRWRFQERSLQSYANPEATKTMITTLMAEALLAWGDAAPIRFTYDNDVWDFEIAVRQANDCDITGCVMASAFFPDGGRHELVIYPMMFEQDPQERLETLIHEIGHIFGLRHFFALEWEQRWPAEVFGVHREESIMNYGEHSRLTAEDRADLKRLYELAWSGQLTHINGTRIRLMRPYHVAAQPTAGVLIQA